MIETCQSSAAEIVTACATSVGVLIAGVGLTTWRKQLKGTYEYELAKKLMLQVYQLRESLKTVRDPFLHPAEANDSDNSQIPWEVLAYEKRWSAVRKAAAQFDTTSLEAEVLWGKSVTQRPLMAMRQTVIDLSIAVRQYMRERQDETGTRGANVEYADILYSTGSSDSYNLSLDSAVKAYEDILKPYLRKEDGKTMRIRSILGKLLLG